MRRRLRAALALVVLAVATGSCAGLDATPIAQPSSTPVGSPALGAAAEAARAAVFAALGRANLVVAETGRPFRSAESAPLAAAPRNVYQVTLPADPDDGFIVVYELPSEADAAAAAEEQRAYLASGPGRVQAPPGTDHVIQRLGATVIVYDWLPAAAEDPAAPRVAEALRTVGETFVVGP